MEDSKIVCVNETLIGVFKSEKKDIEQRLFFRYFLNFIINVVYPFVKVNPHFTTGTMSFSIESERADGILVTVGCYSEIIKNSVSDDSLPFYGFNASYLKINHANLTTDYPTSDLDGDDYPDSGLDRDFINGFARPFLSRYSDTDIVKVDIDSIAVNEMIRSLFVNGEIFNSTKADNVILEFIKKHLDWYWID
jgi:hypothetical protein